MCSRRVLGSLHLLSFRYRNRNDKATSACCLYRFRFFLLQARAEEMGQDLVQVSAHIGARESHQEWQGKIFSLNGFTG